jgi:rod shape-determining protein MreC
MRVPGSTTVAMMRGGISMGARYFLLALACFVLMVLDHRDEQVTSLRQGLSVLVYPLRMMVDFPFSVWEKAKTTFAERQALIEENERLKRERLTTEFRLQRLAALEVENARLRELLDSTERVGTRALIAEILAVDLDPYRQRFDLNRGSLDGVFVGQALIDAKGIVGQVVRVGPLTSEAVLITDADHAVPVTVNRNGLRTIAVGTGDSGRLRLPYLTNNADIEVGDLLVSSGLGGVFPAGYPVGRVIEVKMRPDQAFAEVIAQPVSALDRDREVLLVWNAPEERLREDEAEAAAVADAG